MALTDLTRISTSGIATGTSLSGAILHGDAHFRGTQIGVTSALFDSSDNALEFNDNVKLTFGDSGDLLLYHTGNNSIIRDQGAGTLSLQSNGTEIALYNSANSQYMGKFANSAQVELYYAGNKKFETTQSGSIVTGILTATGFSGPLSNPSGISTFYDLRVTNNLTVEGSTTTLDTNLIGVDRVEVGANSNSIVGVAVTQSGTADIVRLFDGASQVVTVDDQGNVGLGSAIPSAKLDVAGTATISHTGANQLVIQDSNSTGNAAEMRISFKDSGGTEKFFVGSNESSNSWFYLGTPSGQNYPVSIRVNGSDKFQVNSNGVTVNGSYYVQDSLIHDGDTDTKIRFPSADTIQFETGGSNKLSIGSSITSTTPITIYNADPELIFRDSNHSPFYYHFKGIGGAFHLFDSVNGDRMRFSANGSASVVAPMFVMTGGAQVSSNLGVTGSIIISDQIYHNGDTDTKIRFPADDKFRIELGGVTSAFSGLKSTSGATHAKWGINVATPQAALHIDEAYNHQGILRVTNGNQGTGYYHQLEMSGTQNIFTLWRHYNGSNYYNTHAHGSTGHRWYINGSEAVRVHSDGKVGIGTDNPSKALHVDGTIFASGATTSLDGGLRIQPNNDGTNYGGVIYGGAHNDNNTAIYMRRGADGGNDTIDINSYGMFRVFTNGALASQDERLRIDSNGALRVNTTRTTATKLHVVGGTASGTAYDVAVFAGGQNSTSGSGVKLYLSGCENDPLSRGVILESIMTDNANAHRFSIKVGGPSAAPTERFRITPSGAHFYGNQTNLPNGVFGFRYDKSNDTDLSIENLDNSSVNNNAGIRLASNHSNIRLRYLNNGGFYIQNASAAGYLHYYEGGVSRLYIDTNGKIGINETSPQQQVHVHCDTNYQGILINGNGAPRIAFARSTTTTGEWSVGIDGTNGNNFVINNSNDNSNSKIILSSSQVTLTQNTQVNGNLKFGSAGNGIDFSETANGGTGTPSELLDDYEEGYFAPTIKNLSSGYASGTFYNRQARYTKVGNMVTCWVHLQWWANATTTDNSGNAGGDNLEFTIEGFPFEVDGVGYSGCGGGGLQSQSWRFSGSGFNNYAVTSDNVQPRIDSLERIRFGVIAHNAITGQVTQKSINGYSPNIEFVFTVRVTSYK